MDSELSSVQCKSVHEYLKSLPSGILEKLYNHPMTCLAIFRELSEYAKHYILRLLFIEQPIPKVVVKSWLSKAEEKEHEETVKSLMKLNIFHEAALVGEITAWTLNPTFKRGCRVSLFGGGKIGFMTAELEPDTKPRDIAFLDAYATERWECMLYYMVGSANHEGMSNDALQTLIRGNLITHAEGGAPTITQRGFQFLLMDTPSQVWYFMLQYLNSIEDRKLDLVQCLMFLFQLRFCILGKDYSTDGLTDGMLVFLQHLREFGLVYQRKRKAGRFYPTRLVLSMGSPESSSLDTTKEEGYIVVETNYRVYVYTDSNLKIAIVGLFCNFLYRFPKVTVGVLTRDSVRAALRTGITARQIVNFLYAHAHPTMLTGSIPAMPPTVVDQIFLWEQERNRFNYTEGVLCSQFVSQNDFESLRNYAQNLGVLIWQAEKRRIMVVSKDSYDDVRKYWKKYLRGGST